MKHVRSENDAKLGSGHFKGRWQLLEIGDAMEGGGMILEGRLKK
jgi:hypothetical protein